MGKICRVNPLMPGCNKKVTHCLNIKKLKPIKKEDISGNRITDANIFSDIFVNFYVRYANNVHWFLVKEEKKSKDLHHSCI